MLAGATLVSRNAVHVFAVYRKIALIPVGWVAKEESPTTLMIMRVTHSASVTRALWLLNSGFSNMKRGDHFKESKASFA